MKTTSKAKFLFSILSLSGVGILASTTAAQAQRVCIVTENNQFVCGRPATDRDSDNFNRNNRSQQNFYNDINDIYVDILSRNVDNRNLEIWTRALRNGRPLKDIRREVANSPQARAQINQLYQEVLGRSIDDAGIQTWTRKLADGDSIRDVRRSLERSDEARNRRK
ncbi:MAG: DUF4214 domain-containing protein [Coleofasciculaceae cyanobacterium]